MKQHKDILLFDGFCVLCSFFVRKVIDHYGASLNLVSMQSPKGRAIIRSFGLPDKLPDEVLLVKNREVFKGAEAIVQLSLNGTGIWRFAGVVAQSLPGWLTRGIYRLIATNRYHWFGRRASCYLG